MSDSKKEIVGNEYSRELETVTLKLRWATDEKAKLTDQLDAAIAELRDANDRLKD